MDYKMFDSSFRSENLNVWQTIVRKTLNCYKIANAQNEPKRFQLK